jgi:hypothetical protein
MKVNDKYSRAEVGGSIYIEFFCVLLYQKITDTVKLTGREEHIGELPSFAGTPCLFFCTKSSRRCYFENHSIVSKIQFRFLNLSDCVISVHKLLKYVS